MGKWFLASAVGVAVLLGVGAVTWAFGRGDWGHRFGDRGPHHGAARLLALLDGDRVKSELGLSDEQATRLHQIAFDAEKSSIKTRAEMAIHRVELQELLGADNPDREAVMNKVQELSSLRGEMMKQRFETLLAVKGLLTPDQQKKIRTFIEHRHAARPREQFRGHHGPPGRPPEPPERSPKPPV